MRRWILIALALGSIWFACSSQKKAEENVAIQPVAVSAETIAAAQDKAAQPAEAAGECPHADPSGATPCGDHAAQKAAPTAAEDGERVFGAPLKEQSEPLTVATLLDDPKPYLGKVVKAKGTVSRVCERAGCWLELASVQGGLGLRVPMANHAFFIPGDAVGRPAIVEGQLSTQALPEAHKKHLAGEGAQELGPLFLAATTVVVQ